MKNLDNYSADWEGFRNYQKDNHDRGNLGDWLDYDEYDVFLEMKKQSEWEKKRQIDNLKVRPELMKKKLRNWG